MLGILSDAHGNLDALKTALSVLSKNGANQFIFLGDAVGYFPGFQVIDYLSTNAIRTLKGNHEQMLLDGNFPSEKDAFYLLSETASSIPQPLLEYIKTRPDHLTLFPGDKQILLVHGSPSDYLSGYVYPDTDLEFFIRGLNSINTVFMGHTHRPFIRRHRDVTFVNVGSCAMPRDSGEFGSACLFDESSGAIRILRFSISKDWDNALKRYPNIHHSVREMRTRPSENIFGEFTNGETL
jgi:predicted phosphodiesterase